MRCKRKSDDGDDSEVLTKRQVEVYLEQLNLACPLHDQDKIVSVCFDAKCTTLRPACAKCLVQHHQNHQFIVDFNGFMFAIQNAKVETLGGFKKMLQTVLQGTADILEDIEAKFAGGCPTALTALTESSEYCALRNLHEDLGKIDCNSQTHFRRQYQTFFEDDYRDVSQEVVPVDHEYAFVQNAVAAVSRNISGNGGPRHRKSISKVVISHKNIIERCQQLNLQAREFSQKAFQQQQQQQQNIIPGLRHLVSVVAHERLEERKEVLIIGIISKQDSVQQRILTVGRDGKACVFALPQLEPLYSFRVRVQPNYQMLCVRNKELFLINDGVHAQQINVYRVTPKEGYIVKRFTKSQGFSTTLVTLIVREKCEQLLAVHKVDSRSCLLTISNLNSGKVMLQRILAGSSLLLDTFDQSPYIFTALERQRKLQVFNIFSKRTVVDSWLVESDTKLKIESIYAYKRGDKLNVACSLCTYVDAAQIVQQEQQQLLLQNGNNQQEFRTKILELDTDTGIVQVLYNLDHANFLRIGFMFTPLLDSLLCFDVHMNTRKQFTQQNRAVKNCFRIHQILLGATENHHQVGSEVVPQQKTIFSQSSGSVNCVTSDWGFQHIILGQENGKIKVFDFVIK